MSSFFSRARRSFPTKNFLIGRATRVAGAAGSGYIVGRYATTRGRAVPLIAGSVLIGAALWLEMTDRSPGLASILEGVADGALSTAASQAGAAVGLVHDGKKTVAVTTKQADRIHGMQARAVLGAAARSTAAGRPVYLSAARLRDFARYGAGR